MKRRERRAPRALRELQEETASRQRRRVARAAQVRRRRLTALVVAGLVVIGAGGAGIALSSGSGSGAGGTRQRALGPVGPARTLTPVVRPPAAASVPGRAAAFHPSPAVRALASSMTLPQQVAQLFLASVDGTDQAAVRGLGSTPWGGVVLDESNVVSNSQVASLVSDVVSAVDASGPVPPIIAAAQAGGVGTAFRNLPPAAELAVGETGRPSVAFSQALSAGTALKRLGIAMTIAPWVDVDTAQGALTGELFSTNPSTVATFAEAALNGYAQAGVIAAAAHFPGEGAASADPDQINATVGGSLAALRGRDLIPFSAIASRAPVIVMSNASYVAFDGVTPASLLPAAVSLLRSLGFAGVVMSDDLDATLNATAESPGEVALAALRAGDDLLYITGPPGEQAAAYGAVLAAATHSAADRALLHEALLRDLALKARYGLLH